MCQPGQVHEGPCMSLIEVTPDEGRAEEGCLLNAPHLLTLVPRHYPGRIYRAGNWLSVLSEAGSGQW